ncbi:DMT family transporter [bacterium]|nr:DMT family transporter [bacterium]
MGEFYALMCAVVWAVAVIFLKRSGETVPPFALNLFRVGVSSLLLVATLYATGQSLVLDVPLKDYLVLIASGVIAIAMADTMFHRSLNIVGAGVTAIVDCLYSPLVVAFAFLMLDERLSAFHLLGMGLIIGGVLLASRIEPPAGLDRACMLRGVMWGVGSMLTLSLGVVMAKSVLADKSVLWATTVRQLGALAVMVPVALVSSRRGDYLRVFKPRRDWRFTLPGTVLGSYASLLFWLAGMKYTEAGTAAILNQTSTIFILVFATLFLREAFSRRKFAAAALAILGILFVTVF